MSYTPLPPSFIDEDLKEYGSTTPNDDDTTSIISHAAPISGYKPYRPPQSSPSSTPAIIYTPVARLPTPPTHNPISWAGIFPSRTPSRSQRRCSPVPSLGVRPQLSAPYEESLPWANQSTHFRTASTGSCAAPEYASLVGESESRPASKQYFRNPRHVRAAWGGGAGSMGLWKGVGALGGVVLLTASSIALLTATHQTPTANWTPFPPSTYLAILELLTISLTLFAFTQGCVLIFWRRLLAGTTIGDMYDTYEAANLFSSLRLLWRWQLHPVAIATLFSTLSLVRGPLFQCALIMKDEHYDLRIAPMILGAVFSFSSLIAILPLYHNSWRLGRHVSVNPLEIARAFGAPLFDGVDGNLSARDIEIERGSVAVRYGAVERSGEEKVLRVWETARGNVRTPRVGEIFG